MFLINIRLIFILLLSTDRLDVWIECVDNLTSFTHFDVGVLYLSYYLFICFNLNPRIIIIAYRKEFKVECKCLLILYYDNTFGGLPLRFFVIFKPSNREIPNRLLKLSFVR